MHKASRLSQWYDANKATQRKLGPFMRWLVRESIYRARKRQHEELLKTIRKHCVNKYSTFARAYLDKKITRQNCEQTKPDDITAEEVALYIAEDDSIYAQLMDIKKEQKQLEKKKEYNKVLRSEKSTISRLIDQTNKEKKIYNEALLRILKTKPVDISKISEKQNKVSELQNKIKECDLLLDRLHECAAIVSADKPKGGRPKGKKDSKPRKTKNKSDLKCAETE